MLLQIIQGTPLRIWVLFFILVGVGVMQARKRTVASLRAIILPGVFVVLSLAGVISTFGVHAAAVTAWAVGIGTAAALGPRLLPAVRATWQAASDTLHVAGSWLPLGLIVALFAVKYAAGVSLALHPSLASQTDFVVACSVAYGVFSGLFAARGLQLWRVRAAARA